MQSQAQRMDIPSGDVQLEGILQSPGPNPSGLLVVCHPHPLYGGSMHNNVVDALCDAALQEGVAALRFNFRGVGGSGGTHSGGDAEQSDVLGALAAAAGMPGGSVIGLAGYSFGASMATRAIGGVVSGPKVLVLVSPPLSTLGAPLFGDEPASRLLITGDSDHVCPFAELETLAGRLRPVADCVVVEGADHSWFGHEAELRDTVGSFLRWHLIAPRPGEGSG